jgi:hypothetical protein
MIRLLAMGRNRQVAVSGPRDTGNEREGKCASRAPRRRHAASR